MAAALTHDVASYCISRCSTVYTCSLDAEGAFDTIPHPMLFKKSMDVIPEHCWRLLVCWYKNVTVLIKWGYNLSESINVCKGTRQGGLSSPLLFNMFYFDLIETLSKANWDICINGQIFYVFCYVDDILLASLTATGLHNLINIANSYITNHGLCFNPAKTECTVFGRNYLQPGPKWHLNNACLTQNSYVTYLGVHLSSVNRSLHVTNRIKACRNSFYSMQGIGMCDRGCSSDTICYVWNTAIRQVLIYGIQCINISKTSQQELEKIQTKLLKVSLGIHKFCRNECDEST